MINVYIVEDDPMVADINKQYLESIPGFTCIGVGENASVAWSYLDTNQVDLILLDIFMPQENGLQLFADIRKAEKKIDVIVISASSDMENIKTALRLGASDYLIKPFTYERFTKALHKYQKEHEFMKDQAIISQEELDEQLLYQSKIEPIKLPKGITQATLQRVVKQIIHKDKSFTTLELAEELEISRVSIRKYLHFLQEIDFLSLDLHYKPTGRPIHHYIVKPTNIEKVKPYLPTTNI